MDRRAARYGVGRRHVAPVISGSAHTELPPGGDDLTITMVRELKVRGLVVDAQTRNSVPTFTLVPGLEGGGASPTYWDRGSARSQNAGRYEITFDQSAPHGRRLRIEADGYMPAISRQIRDGEEDPVINFVLEKGAGISGVAFWPTARRWWGQTFCW